ncbi:hypothetical protein EUGRSUZ_L03487 [Eucalyptus grandis]|uniref:Uncharacterized protein n=1 Tax=Eucalyptus grandis TaxID=71139 RepID=A0AAD9WGK1_EUCGR|nr:hypothetical protein EUGRSUZ_L03487 [Eucalyptus grandis]
MKVTYCAVGRSLSSLVFASLFAVSSLQLEQEAETVVRVLQPGPLGIIEHKFSTEEINEANATPRRAVEAWRRSAELEKRKPFLRDHIES